MSLNDTSCDILVVGAGIAGLSAAVTSAEKGCRTILIEKDTHCGGIIRNAFLNEMCGLFYSDKNQSPILLNDGLSKRIYQTLAQSNPYRLRQKGKVIVLPIKRDKLFTYFERLLKVNNLLDVRYNHEMISLTKSKTQIKNVVVKNNLNSKTSTITPKIVIDCSGSGSVLTAAEQKDSEYPNKQLSGVTIIIESTTKCDALLALKVPYSLNTAVKEGKFPNYVKFTTVSQGEKNDELNIKVNIDSTIDSFLQIKNTLTDIHSYLKENIDSLRDSTIKYISPKICHREENRLKGRYIITESDIITGRKFKDGCIKCAWPIEYWDIYNGVSYQYLKSDDYYEIPIRCMQAADISNLYAAGRCIAATPKALASTRVTGICMSLGEQAALSAVARLKD